MHTSASLIIVIATAVQICQAAKYTYWIDKSCSDRDQWKPSFDEFWKMAKRGGERLKSPTDTDYGAVFKRIFSVDKADGTKYESPVRGAPKATAHEIVRGIVESIGADWREVTTEEDRIASEVRVYCDNDARFEKKTKADGNPVWLDTKNGMVAISGPSCPRPRVAGRVYHLGKLNFKTSLDGHSEPQQHNADRASMTICDNLWDARAKKPKLPSTMGDVPLEKDMTKLPLGVSDFVFMISHTILHEWTHTRKYFTQDRKEDSAPYGWENITVKKPENAVQNADNYAYLGLFALLADHSPPDGGGFTLPRLDDGPDAEKDAKAGQLRLYKDLTKRFLRDSVPRGFVS